MPLSSTGIFARISPLAEAALRTQRSGFSVEADWLMRLAHARGERGGQIGVEIDRMTTQALARLHGVEVQRDDHEDGVLLTSAGSIRNFFERELESRMTLMDAVNMLDMALPLYSLAAIKVKISERDETRARLSFFGSYQPQERFASTISASEMKHTIDVIVDRGRVNIDCSNLGLPRVMRGYGIGARDLLAKSLVARLHGNSSWGDHIAGDGLFAWPRLGAIPDAHHVDQVVENLQRLQGQGVTRQIAIVGRDLESLAQIQLEESDIVSRSALEGWCRSCARMSETTAQTIAAPYPVGLWALRGMAMCADFPTETILKNLLNDYFPIRVTRKPFGSSAHELERRAPGIDKQARRAFAVDYERSYRREYVAGVVLQDLGMTTAQLVQNNPYHLVLPSPVLLTGISAMAMIR